jgi:hypothetical protein
VLVLDTTGGPGRLVYKLKHLLRISVGPSSLELAAGVLLGELFKNIFREARARRISKNDLDCDLEGL